MRIASPRHWAFGLALSMVIAACSSAQAPSDAGVADGSIADASGPDASGPDASALEASAPQCVHNPASSAPLPATATDTLPTGACDASQAACDLVVRQECTCDPAEGSIRIYFHCACSNATWDCVETDIDSRTCRRIGDPDCPLDASARSP